MLHAGRHPIVLHAGPFPMHNAVVMHWDASLDHPPKVTMGARLFGEGLLRPFLLRRSFCLVRSLQFVDVVTFVALGRVHALDEGVATFSARSAGDDICTAMVQRKQG